MNMTLRAAEESDAAALSELGRDTFIAEFAHLYKPKDLQDFLAGVYAPRLQLQEIISPYCRVMLAEQDGRLVGYAKSGPCKLPYSPMPDNAYELQRIYLREEAKGQGIGRALVKDALGYFRQKSASAVFLGVWAENYAAHAFYKSLGFEKVGDYHFMVGGKADDEWIMRLKDWP